MKLYDVCIRGFVKGNLGDDLFVDVLCRRYPNTRFVICGEKAYKRCFAEISNLKYISSDTVVFKLLFKVIKTPAWCVNKLILKCGGKKQFAYFGCEQLLQLLSKENVLISGSVFMELQNKPFIMGAKQVSEQKYYRRKPYVIGCNFGPYYNEEYRKFYQECFRKAKQICFRERYSYKMFEGENIQWGADIVFSYSKDRIVLPEEKEYIAISVLNLNKDVSRDSESVERYVKGFADAIKSLLERGERVALVGFCNAQGDDAVIRDICERCANDKRILVYNYPTMNYREMIGVLAGAKAIISTRYHGMILGWLFGKRVLPIVYSSKMKHVIDDVNSEMPVCSLDDKEFSYYKLLDAYDRMLKEPYKIDIEGLVRSAQTHFEKLDKQLN